MQEVNLNKSSIISVILVLSELSELFWYKSNMRQGKRFIDKCNPFYFLQLFV